MMGVLSLWGGAGAFTRHKLMKSISISSNGWGLVFPKKAGTGLPNLTSARKAEHSNRAQSRECNGRLKCSFLPGRPSRESKSLVWRLTDSEETKWSASSEIWSKIAGKAGRH